MAFAYIPMSPDDKKLLETIFTDEFMQAETNFEAFRDFSVFQRSIYKLEIRYYGI